jgi:YidC/Oxa1 family membrane protein insertase
MNNNNNFIAFVVLSALLLMGFQYFYVKPMMAAHPQIQTGAQTVTQTATHMGNPDINSAKEPDARRNRAEAVKENPRLVVTTPELKGTINLKGARFDDMLLNSYHETVDPTSAPVTLLSPSGSAAPHDAFYTELGWLGETSDIKVPTSDSVWITADKDINPKHSARLTWSNNAGLNFERTIAVDEHFMFTVTDRVTNSSGKDVTLYPFGTVARRGNPVTRAAAVLHEGPLGVLGGSLQEATYKKLIDHARMNFDSDGGWLGITDKYWLVALAPTGTDKLNASFQYHPSSDSDPNQGYFQSDYRGSAVTIASGASTERITHIFIGAKRFKLLNTYMDDFNIPLFNHAIDFGWFWFLTIPFLHLLNHLGETLGSYGLAILVFTVMLKLITLPLSLKSNHSMARMKDLQPEIKKLQERYAEDKLKLNQETMELFKREKVNPMSGCVPMLIQIPIFFALYKVLYVGIELRQAPFYGWIKDMSLPDPTSALTLFGLVPVDLPPAMHIGAWPILMGVGMFLQQRMSPQPMADKTQARMMMMMPIIFTYMLASMPAGLVIYWTWSNLLSIGQQWYITRVDAKRRAAAKAIAP